MTGAGAAVPRRPAPLGAAAASRRSRLTMPIPPKKSTQVPLTKTFNGLYHLALERQPTHLAVRQHCEAGLFLLGDRFVYGAVFDALVSWTGDLAGS